MNLDLDLVTSDWHTPPDEICARVIRGMEGGELVQLKVDLGVLQMHMDGRPDGQRFHGMPSAAEFIAHELRVHRDVGAADWAELNRELQQLNYRRLAFSVLADQALRDNNRAVSEPMLRRAFRDITHCLGILRTFERHQHAVPTSPALRAALVYNRTLVASRLRVVEGLIDEAIDEIGQGRRCLDELLERTGAEPEAREADPGLTYLKQQEAQLRHAHGVRQTLRERIEAAVENEDFETAARLRDELRRRPKGYTVSEQF
ncbi:MAG: UvrB/UvrC motif-containing protein [Phycisphaerae bacterium]|nr:UvrB/UvrC motif-containing protein [Phycisphaerae bacterium]MCZ2401512.1 UvrB/UvrC motif-containing protein [Phycisphaerae bacterium]NUQ49583.1 UvrB/UvrC motif-containing protein [Phycisphaerae bacterium]